MSIRDRVTVRMRDGNIEQMVVVRQGGSIDQVWPRKGETNYEAHMVDKTGMRTGESVILPIDMLAAVITDVAPKEARKVK